MTCHQKRRKVNSTTKQDKNEAKAQAHIALWSRSISPWVFTLLILQTILRKIKYKNLRIVCRLLPFENYETKCGEEWMPPPWPKVQSRRQRQVSLQHLSPALSGTMLVSKSTFKVGVWRSHSYFFTRTCVLELSFMLKTCTYVLASVAREVGSDGDKPYSRQHSETWRWNASLVLPVKGW